MSQGAALHARARAAAGRVRGGLHAHRGGVGRPAGGQSAFRAGLGARFTFLSDAERRWLPRLGLLESTDTSHEPYLPAGFTLFPDLTIHRAYNGYWFWGRATMEDLRQDMRQISQAIRADWELPER